MSVRVVPLLLAVVLLAACDASSGVEITPPEGAITLDPLDVTAVDLDDTFPPGAGLEVEVLSVSGPIIAKIEGGRLLVEPTAEGQGEVVVVAKRDRETVDRVTYSFVTPAPPPLADRPPVSVAGGGVRLLDVSDWVPQADGPFPGLDVTSPRGIVEGWIQGGDTLALEVQPVIEDGEQVVTLRTTRFVPRTFSVPVQVRASCPADVPGAADYFPFEGNSLQTPGDSWTFDFEYRNVDRRDSSGTRIAGTVVWTAYEQGCSGEARETGVQVHYTGTEERRDAGGVWTFVRDWERYARMTFTEDPNHFVIGRTGLQWGPGDFVIRRAVPGLTDETVVGGPVDARWTARRGVGLLTFRGSDRAGTYERTVTLDRRL